MKTLFLTILWLPLLLSAAGCGPNENAIAQTIVSQVSVAVESTIAAVPTATPYPTLTPLATYTPYPTLTPHPTYTPAPTPTLTGASSFVCEDTLGCLNVALGDPIHIAYALALSGVAQVLGEDSKGGIQLAIDDRDGQVIGHRILLTGTDTRCSYDGGEAAGLYLAADPTIVGIIGTNCSSAARAIMPYVSQAGMVMISPSNTNPDLTDLSHPDHWPGYLRTAHNDLLQGRIAAEFAYNDLGLRRAATLHDGSPYAAELQQVFANRFTELGGTITDQESINAGDTDPRPTLNRIATGNPEALYFPIFEPEGDYVITYAREVAGLENVTLISADGLFAYTFPSNVGEAAIGMYLTAPYVGGESYEAFLDRWQARFGGFPPSGFHAHAYDATNMLLNAIETVAVVEPDGALHIGRQALRDALYATQNFAGLTGTLFCNEGGDRATGEALAVFQITEAEVNQGNWPPPVVGRP